MRTDTLHIRVTPDEKRHLEAAAAAAKVPLATYLHRLLVLNLALDGDLAAIRQSVESRPAGGQEPEPVDIRREVKTAVADGLADIRRAVESAAAIRLRDMQSAVNETTAAVREIESSVASMLAEEVVELRRAIDEVGILPENKRREFPALLELLFLFRAISKRERVEAAHAELAKLGIKPVHPAIAVAPKPAEPEPVPEPEKKRGWW